MLQVIAPSALVLALGSTVAGCGADTLGVATTVVPVQPTNFATIPPVSSTAPGTTSTLPQGAVGQEQIYTVKAGDSASLVASKYGISVTALLAYNGYVSAQQFPYPGQTLKIPPSATGTGTDNTTATSGGTTGATTSGATPGCTVTRPAGTYVIAAGDSLYRIKNKFNVTISALLSANNWSDMGSVVLLPGKTINIPAACQ